MIVAVMAGYNHLFPLFLFLLVWRGVRLCELTAYCGQHVGTAPAGGAVRGFCGW